MDSKITEELLLNLTKKLLRNDKLIKDELEEKINTTSENKTVSVNTDITTEGFSKSYTIKQGNDIVGVVDIPKELSTESGEIVINPEGHPEGYYLKLVITNKTDPVYINVDALIAIRTVQDNATQIKLTIDPSNKELSASILEGSVGTRELADQSITTDKIADNSITEDKLDDDVKERINTCSTWITL